MTGLFVSISFLQSFTAHDLLQFAAVLSGNHNCSIIFTVLLRYCSPSLRQGWRIDKLVEEFFYRACFWL